MYTNKLIYLSYICIYIYIYVYVSLSLSLCIYNYIYIYICRRIKYAWMSSNPTSMVRIMAISLKPLLRNVSYVDGPRFWLLTKDPCALVFCTEDMCPDGEPRRKVGDQCCSCGWLSRVHNPWKKHVALVFSSLCPIRLFPPPSRHIVW